MAGSSRCFNRHTRSRAEETRHLARVFPTGDQHIDSAVADVVREVSRALPSRTLGFYLHGSTFSGTRAPTSDIDVLVLGDDHVGPNDNAAAAVAALPVSTRYGVQLDVKAFSASAFVSDPWVDIWRGAAFVGGVDWRADIPAPSLDDRAREAVLHACLIGARTRALSFKASTWLVSALLAVRHGYAPPTRLEAIEQFQAQEPELAELVRAATVIGLTEDASARLIEVVTRDLLADLASPTPRLGPRCHAVIRARLAE